MFGGWSGVNLWIGVGPCSVNPDLSTTVNPFSYAVAAKQVGVSADRLDRWSEESNLLFLSQPLGVGFSYESEMRKTYDRIGYRSSSSFNGSSIDRSEIAALVAWKTVQAFLLHLPRISPRVRSRTFHLWTERYNS